MNNANLMEAARLTGLARELMERFKYEGIQAALHSRSSNNETSQNMAAKHRAFAVRLDYEARELTAQADRLYTEARA